jgi:hypothetical protein
VRIALVVLGTLAVLLVAGGQLRPRGVPSASAASLRVLCGTERWSVKTLSDGDRWQVDLTPRYRTIKQLNALTKPAHLPANGRVADERKVYRVTATVFATITEDDGDIHLALRGGDGSTMIAEAPEPACTVGARDRPEIKAARLAAQDVQPGEKVTAAGVGFYDFPHHQTRHANNYIELHPLLAVQRR